MNKTPKLWEILAAFIPVVTGIIIWIWNLASTVNNNTKDIDYLRQNQTEYKSDVKQINETLKTILIKIENKQDRK